MANVVAMTSSATQLQVLEIPPRFKRSDLEQGGRCKLLLSAMDFLSVVDYLCSSPLVYLCVYTMINFVGQIIYICKHVLVILPKVGENLQFKHA